MSATAQVNELMRAVEREVDAALDGEVMERFRQKVRDLGRDMESEMYDGLKDSLAINLADFTKDMAEKAVGALLEGNEEQMRRYLKCQPYGYTGRSDGVRLGRQRKDHELHPVIHGSLFEPDPVKIRRKIAQAHRDLIASERIKDLEEQVKSLVAQVARAQAENDRLMGREP